MRPFISSSSSTLKTLALAAFALGGAALAGGPAHATEFMVNQGDGVCPTGYRLAEMWEVDAEKSAACNTLGQWYIARVAGGGSQDGPGYECRSRTPDTRPLGHSLCVKAPDLALAAGEYTWVVDGRGGGVTTIKADGTCTNDSSKMTCVWLLTDASTRTFSLNWNNRKYIDTLTLSADGKTLTGKNQVGSTIKGVKR